MKTIGIIMEINPFHNGHKYFLEQIRAKHPKEYIICIITTTITQRGEISILSKRVKTNLLLDHGVDLVVELPTIFSNQGGEYYGYYNVKILNELKIDILIFGSESANMCNLKKHLNEANTSKNFEDGYLKNSLGNLKSNDILAISYLKAINKINPNIKVEIIQRIESNYNDENLKLETNICSATAIRKNINNREIKKYLPSYSYNNIIKINAEHLLVQLLLFQLLNVENDKIFLSEEGELISKIKKRIKHLTSEKPITKYTYYELAKLCADKNNSQHKMKRLFINIIFQITNHEVQNGAVDLTKYKVLGFSKRYSKNMKNNEKLFLSYKESPNTYKINDKVDKILNIYFEINYKQNYQKPIIK